MEQQKLVWVPDPRPFGKLVWLPQSCTQGEIRRSKTRQVSQNGSSLLAEPEPEVVPAEPEAGSESDLLIKGGRELVHAFGVICDMINHPSRWPDAVAWIGDRLLLKSNLNHRERPILTAFLYQNGVSPYWIRTFYRANGSLRDDSAWRDVEGLIAQFRTNSDATRRLRKFYAFDLIHGRVCWLDGTPRKKE